MNIERVGEGERERERWRKRARERERERDGEREQESVQVSECECPSELYTVCLQRVHFLITDGGDESCVPHNTGTHGFLSTTTSSN